MSDLFTESGAVFSPCGLYRYRLWRYWDRAKLPLCFLMLNPSTADDLENDPTVERCQRRALMMGFGGLEVVNIFAFRSTDPAGLLTISDPVGPENDAAIKQACRLAGMVVCAWGEHGKIGGRSEKILEMLAADEISAHALAVNSSGEPKHPLYVSYDLRPMPFNNKARELR